jgi:hypothetical protein
MKADSLYHAAEINRSLSTEEYLEAQSKLMRQAQVLVGEGDD